MVNSSDPSNNCASLQSYYSRLKASRELQPSSEQPVTGRFFCEIFWQPLLQRVDTPPGLPEPKLLVGAKISGNRSLTCLHTLSLSLTCQHVRARGSFSSRRTSPPESLATNLQAYVPGFLIQHMHPPLLSIFLFGNICFQILFYFSSKSDTTEAPLTIWSCLVPSESTDSVASVTLY